MLLTQETGPSEAKHGDVGGSEQQFRTGSETLQRRTGLGRNPQGPGDQDWDHEHREGRGGEWRAGERRGEDEGGG